MEAYRQFLIGLLDDEMLYHDFLEIQEEVLYIL